MLLSLGAPAGTALIGCERKQSDLGCGTVECMAAMYLIDE